MSGARHSVEYDRFRDAMIAARRGSGLSQEALAVRLGKPQSFVSKYERGERRLDVVEFLHLCDSLGVDAVSVLEKVRPQRKVVASGVAL